MVYCNYDWHFDRDLTGRAACWELSGALNYFVLGELRNQRNIQCEACTTDRPVES